jgi:hypothetical protein
MANCLPLTVFSSSDGHENRKKLRRAKKHRGSSIVKIPTVLTYRKEDPG